MEKSFCDICDEQVARRGEGYMKGQAQLFSSNSDEWATPQVLFDELNAEFGFTLDAAADYKNKKCREYWSMADDALKQDWQPHRIWCNPPYSQWQKFVKHCSDCGGFAVMLLPARTDTKAFHDYIYNKPNVEIRFIRGRLKFGDSKNSAPFPSMIVIFKGTEAKE